MFKTDVYIERRQRLRERVTRGLILLPGNRLSAFSGPDSFHQFRQDSSFLYFAGLDVPGLTLILDLDSGAEILFGEEPSPDEFIWSGVAPSLSDHAAKAGIDQTASFHKLQALLLDAKKAGRTIHLLPPYQGDVILSLRDLLGVNGGELQAMVSEDLIRAVVALRSIKDAQEIQELDKAVSLTQRMHSTAMIMAMPGASEQDIKGIIEGMAISQGGGLSFQPIVTTRGDVLHNLRYTHALEDGRMLVIDAGAESPRHYAGDITRSIPVGRSFNRRQKSIYELVLKSNLAAIEMIRPGVSYKDVHLKAAQVIAEGLKEMAILKGDPAEAVQAGAHALFFPHGIGHMLGLDVHDMESLGEDNVGYDETVQRSEQFGLAALRMARSLEAGHVVTVEPGIYFIEPLINRWKQENRCADFINYKVVEDYLGFGGVRIEDDLLVTETGSRLLGNSLAKTVKEIEDF